MSCLRNCNMILFSPCMDFYSPVRCDWHDLRLNLLE